MKKHNLIIVALISLTIIPLELVWTRVFSAEFFFTFAFLVLSLAILGLGLGALSLRLFPSIDKERNLGIFLSLTGLMAIIGPLLVFKISLDFSLLFSSWLMIGKFIITIILLSSSFLFSGMALALLFKNNHAKMPRLYMADLLGAGVGVLLIIWVMNQFGTPVASFLTAIPVLIAAFITCRSWVKIIPALLLITMFGFTTNAEELLEKQRKEHAPVIYKHWDAMSKIKVYDYGEGYRGINIDNVANSPVVSFDGDWDDVDTAEIDWGIDVSYLINKFDSCTFLSLGSGGGGDVMQALVEGATDIHAVEVNPHINFMMTIGDPTGYLPIEPPVDTVAVDSALTTDSVADFVETSNDSSVDSVEEDSKPVDSTPKIITLAEFSGHIYDDPKVKVVTEDARAYVRRHKGEFDVIFSLSSNSWAALASGAMALAENYIFTTEAFQDYWEALSDSGFMMMEHQVYMPRLVSELMMALEKQGVVEPKLHFAIYKLPNMRRHMMLLSKRPLTEEIRQLAFGEMTEENYTDIHLLYPPANDSLENNIINQIVQQGWRSASDSAKVDISPATDDRPFIAQLGLWRNFQWDKMEKVIPYADFYGFPLSKIIIIIILIVVLLLVIPLNLLPYMFKGEHLKMYPWLYFFTIGIGFMAVEVILIQKYGLLIGASVYSFATVLLTLLIASGIGSRFSKRFSDLTPFIGIIVMLLLDAFVFKYLIYQFGSFTLIPRVLITVLILFPLGFFMGMPFPKGALRVKGLIDWGFAVNGTASVLGSTMIVLIAFNYGFTISLVLAAIIYLLAGMILIMKRAW